jgi:hypothetical protein
MNEYTTLTDRAELKRLRIEADRGLRRRAELLNRIDELQRSKDAAAAEHEQSLSPIQAELQQVEEQIVARVLDRLEPDHALEARRKELLASIEDANVTLEMQINDVDQRLVLLNRDLISLKIPVRDAIESRLFQLGEVEPQRRHFALNWVCQQLQNAMSAATKNEENIEAFVKRATRDNARKQVATAEGRLARWRVAKEVLGKLICDIRDEATALRQEIIESP